MATFESWEYEEQDEATRWLYFAGGSLLVWLGLRRWSLPAALVTGFGALLVGRGMRQPGGMDSTTRIAGRGSVTRAPPLAPERAAARPSRPGVRPAPRAFDRTAAATAPSSTRAPGNTVRDAIHHDSAVDAASDESFPASDPPSWTPTTSSGPHGT